MAVVDDQRQRAMVGEVDHEPVERVQRLEPDVVLPGRRILEAEQARGRTRCPDERRRTLGRLPEDRLDQLADDPEGE